MNCGCCALLQIMCQNNNKKTRLILKTIHACVCISVIVFVFMCVCTWNIIHTICFTWTGNFIVEKCILNCIKMSYRIVSFHTFTNACMIKATILYFALTCFFLSLLIKRIFFINFAGTKPVAFDAIAFWQEKNIIHSCMTWHAYVIFNAYTKIDPYHTIVYFYVRVPVIYTLH